MMKKWAIAMLASSLLFGAGVYAGTGLNEVKAFKNPFSISINGQQATFKNDPLLYNNKTYLPITELSSMLGVSVKWNERQKSVEIRSDAFMEGASGMVVTANEGGSLSFYHLGTGKKEELKMMGSVHNVQVSPDGKTVWATVVPGNNEQGGDDHGHQQTDSSTGMSGHDRKPDSQMAGDHSSGMDPHVMQDQTEAAADHHENNAESNGHGQQASMDGQHGGVGKLVMIDVESRKVLKEMEVGLHPAHVVLTPDGSQVLVTDSETNTVSIMDSKTFKKTEEVPVGSMPHGTRISSDGKWAYVANMGGTTVSVIDLQNAKEVRQIEVGKAPVQVAITKDGQTLLATLNGEDALAVVDLSKGTVKKAKVGIGPAQVYVDPSDSFAYVANQGTEQAPSETVSKVDLSSVKEVYEVKTGLGAHGVTTSDDGKTVFVTNMFENTLAILDAESGKLLSKQEMGQIPNGVTFVK